MSYILLVEDDALSRMVVEDVLEYGDFPVTLVHVESGEEALEQVQEMLPLLILMDIMLPGMDGLETTRLLREDPLTQDIPIWALTCLDLKRDGLRAIEAGCTTYIRKPIEVKEFSQQLREFVNELSVPQLGHVHYGVGEIQGGTGVSPVP